MSVKHFDIVSTKKLAPVEKEVGRIAEVEIIVMELSRRSDIKSFLTE